MQTHRFKMRQSPEQQAAKRGRADAARLLIDRTYPPERRAGQHRGYVLWVIDGCATRVDLFVPPQPARRARCDSFEARIDDRVVCTGGLRVIDDHALKHHIPRSLPRAAFA